MLARPSTLLACLMLLLGASGCNALNSIGPEICRRPADDEPIDFNGGSVKNGVYMSSEWGVDEPLLYFPGGEFYRINHNLGVVPRQIQLWVAFSGEPFGAGEEDDDAAGSSIAPAAGNQAELKDVTATHIDVLNGSCVDYSLMVVAAAGVTVDGDGAGGMGGAGGLGGAGGMAGMGGN